jgi:glycosyltransferase involved in cell wall biosynthesis
MTSALVVSHLFPSSPEQVHGVYQRLRVQVEALATMVDRVRCLSLVARSDDCSAHLARAHEAQLRLWSPAVSLQLAATADGDVPGWWRQIWQGIFDFRRQPITRCYSTRRAVAAVSRALEERPDIVLAHRLTSMSVFMRIARESPQRLQGIPLYFDMDDIEHVKLVRRLREPARRSERLLLLHVPALLFTEIQAVRLAAATFVCSDSDRRYLSRLSRTNRVQTISNSVSFPTHIDADDSEPLVLFVGAMIYRPNAQAVDTLVRDIWPAVRERVPAARLAIVGSGPEHTDSYRSPDDSVTFTGFVDDLAPWYRRARVVCCPIYQGSGTRVKIIEAAAHAKAIVSTRLGAEGLDFEDDREIILHDAPAQIAAACVRLLRDSGAAARLGRAAAQKARGRYERSRVVKQLADIFRAGGADSLRHGVAA